MLPYLIALDDVIDLPQVVAATCFVADLQQHQAYFLLSQFSRSDSAFLSPLKHAERETETGKREDAGCQFVSLCHLWLRNYILVLKTIWGAIFV